MKKTRTVQRTFCTTREAADLLGISLRTAQLWVENGMLAAWKTEGGHRRISRASIMKLLEKPPTQAGDSPQKSEASKGLTILVVEDEPDLLRVYEMTMARWPMKPRVITAKDGYQGLVLLGSEKPDLLITDLSMPAMDGFRMLRTLIAMPEAAATRIVVVSGLDEPEIASRGGIPSGIQCLPKPTPFNELQLIATNIAERKAMTEG